MIFINILTLALFASGALISVWASAAPFDYAQSRILDRYGKTQLFVIPTRSGGIPIVSRMYAGLPMNP